MTQHIPTELALAEEALRQARQRGDMAAVGEAHRHTQEIRARIGKTRTRLMQLASERIHLLELVEQARIQLRRYERNLDDHNHLMEQLREEVLRLGGSSISLTYSFSPEDTPPKG
jgi:chromosome segregation ATPase